MQDERHWCQVIALLYSCCVVFIHALQYRFSLNDHSITLQNPLHACTAGVPTPPGTQITRFVLLGSCVATNKCHQCAVHPHQQPTNTWIALHSLPDAFQSGVDKNKRCSCKGPVPHLLLPGSTHSVTATGNSNCGRSNRLPYSSLWPMHHTQHKARCETLPAR